MARAEGRARASGAEGEAGCRTGILTDPLTDPIRGVATLERSQSRSVLYFRVAPKLGSYEPACAPVLLLYLQVTAWANLV